MDADFAWIVSKIDLMKAAIGGVIAFPTSMNSILAKGAKQLSSLYDMASRDWKKRPGSSQVTMFGKDGIWLVTPEEIALASEKDTKILAKGGFKVASEWSATMEAGVEAKVFGVVAASLGSGALSEVNSLHAVEIAARKGPVEVRGKHIGLGNVPRKTIEFVDKSEALKALGSLKWPQEPTEKIEAIADEEIKLDSKEQINLASQKSIQMLAGVECKDKKDEGEISVKAKNKIEIEADQSAGTIRMTVGPFVVKVTEKGIELGGLEAKEAEAKAFLKINAAGMISLESGPDAKLMVYGSQGCSMSVGGNSLKVTKSSTTIVADKLNFL